MAEDVGIGFEPWRLAHPPLEAGPPVRLGIAERAVTVLQPVERSVDDGNDIDTGSPRPARLQVQLKTRSIQSDGKVLAEFDHGAPPVRLPRIGQGHVARAELRVHLPLLRNPILDLE